MPVPRFVGHLAIIEFHFEVGWENEAANAMNDDVGTILSALAGGGMLLIPVQRVRLNLFEGKFLYSGNPTFLRSTSPV